VPECGSIIGNGYIAKIDRYSIRKSSLSNSLLNLVLRPLTNSLLNLLFKIATCSIDSYTYYIVLFVPL
jgi:hypothetical protein